MSFGLRRFALASVIMFHACSGSPSSGDAKGAIQQSLDASEAALTPVLNECSIGSGADNASTYRGMPGAVLYPGSGGCLAVRWDASVGAVRSGYGRLFVPVGHYVVDAVGDVRPGADSGTWVTSFNTHMEWNALGKALASAGVAREPPVMWDVPTQLHKNPAGTLVADVSVAVSQAHQAHGGFLFGP